MYTLRLGDSLTVLPTVPSNSIDAIVCDPPYELGFMGKSWDASGIAYNVQLWKEALRVLKPGGHLLAFSGSRTYHRMTCAIEDAGFEIRDQILWVYGSGFPKSLDVSKAIDKAAGAEREVVVGVAGRSSTKTIGTVGHVGGEYMETAPATEAAKQWQGWGTALKPAHEPICVARKPLAKGLTVAANVLEHGTGALNIDGCRVGTEIVGWGGGAAGGGTWDESNCGLAKGGEARPVAGRWPANLIHDGSDEVLALFPETHARGNTNPTKRDKSEGVTGWGVRKAGTTDPGDAGSAARFFYQVQGDSECYANTAELNLNPLEQADVFVQRLVAIAAHHAGKPLSGLIQQFMNDTANALGRNEGTSTQTIQSIGLRYSQELQRINTPEATGNPANLAEMLKPIYTMMTIQDLLSTVGYADVATWPTIGTILEHGARACDTKLNRKLVYCAKTSKKDRNAGCEFLPGGNNHPTVKPTDLMRYLCRLVTPPGGTVLDPFMGSGSTGKAAMLEGFRFVGVEMSEEYMAIAAARIEAAFESTIADMI